MSKKIKLEFLLKTESGEMLTRQQVIDRLCQYDVFMLMRNINLEDYDWLSDTREYGFKGYRNYTDEELKEEWQESEDGYNSMMAVRIITVPHSTVGISVYVVEVHIGVDGVTHRHTVDVVVRQVVLVVVTPVFRTDRII